MFLRKLNLVTGFLGGAGSARVIKVVEQPRAKYGTRKFAKFPELLQNHCILLCFEGIVAEVVFFRALGNFRNFPRPMEFIAFCCVVV